MPRFLMFDLTGLAKLIGVLTISLASFAGPLDADQVTEQQSASYITLRLANAASDDVVEALATISEPVRVMVPPNTAPEDLIRSFCGGSFTSAYYELVKSLNGILNKSQSERPLLLPTCPRYRNQPNVVVRPGDNIDSILQREMGVGQADLITMCDYRPTRGAHASRGCRAVSALQAVEALNGGPKAGLDRLRPGDKITLPSVTRWTNIRLRAGVTPEQAIALVELAAAKSAGRTPALFPPSHLSLVRPLDNGDAAVAGTACDPQSGPLRQPWPFDAAALKTVLESNLDRLKGNVQRTTIRVADTGAEGLDNPNFFPPEALSTNPGASDEKVDGNGVGKYGIAPPPGWEIKPIRNDPYHSHGTEVADLALGGLGFREAFGRVYEMMGVSFARIFDEPAEGQIEIVDAMVSGSLTAKPPEPTVVNLSIGGSTKIWNFFETLINNLSHELIAVVAAGNTPKDIGKQENVTYPASQGGEDSQLLINMIVVGAYGPDERITKFSSFGKRAVDMLAPGCRITFHGPDGANAILHGTSFAAPFVTFVAASLHAMGIPANEIKSRLYASGDYDPTLEDYVISSSRLDIVRALRIFDDILVTDQGEDIPGSLQSGQDLDICKAGSPIAVPSLLKIDVLNSSPHLRLLLKSANGSSYPFFCEPSGEGVLFNRLGAADSKLYRWSSIRALVMAARSAPG